MRAQRFKVRVSERCAGEGCVGKLLLACVAARGQAAAARASTY